MRTTIRLMREKDADAVRKVDAIAFATWARQLKKEWAELPPRTRTNLLALRANDPQGCFVADEQGRVVGFIFSHTWGSVGWFGPFAVLPEVQGRGIGKRLIAASLAYLRQDPARVVGLETMAESPYNLGLYLRQGFQAVLPTFSLSKVLAASQNESTGPARWSSADAETRVRWLADLRAASGQIRPGLDYSKEILSTAQHGLGETLVLCEGLEAIGFSDVQLASSREGWGGELAIVKIMALHPAYTSDVALGALLDATKALARAHGKKTLVVPVNARHTWALERLLERGYRVSGVMIRMVLVGTEVEPPAALCVDFSRWAG